MITLGFILFCALAPVTLALKPKSGQPVAVITLMPVAHIPAAIAATDARIITLLGGGRVIILDAASPELIVNLYRDGATLIVAALFAGCGTTTAARFSTSRS
jgi:hypothetical protein